MSASRQPVVATWLLEHVHFGQANGPLIGDLLEEYGRGRSNGWYWKQVLAAIAVSFLSDISAHWLITIKAVITGWAACFLFQRVAWGMLSHFHLWHLLYYELPIILGQSVATAFTWLVLWCPIWLGSGWFMSRLYRSHLASMVVVFSISVLVWNLQSLPRITNLLFETMRDPRHLPQLLVELMKLILPSMCIVLGGLLASRSRSDYLAA